MFNATDFEYDGISASTFGLKIASMESTPIETTPVFSSSLTTVRSSKSNKFYYAGLTCDTTPTATFSVISETYIDDERRALINAWLIERKGFKKLVIKQEDLEKYTYNCIFTEGKMIYANGHLVGWTLTATFDSEYQEMQPEVVFINGNGSQTRTITIDTDLADEYTYPIIRFKASSTINGNWIKIVNRTDDQYRAFSFSGSIQPQSTITVDNERKIITSDNGQYLLDNFSKKWLRLRNGDNNIELTINGRVELTIPQYKKIGF